MVITKIVCFPTGISSALKKKKKKYVKSPSIWFRIPKPVQIRQSGRTGNRGVTDWLTAYRVVIDYERRRVIAYTQDGTRVVFQGDKHDIFPRCQGQLASWLASLTLEDEVRPDLDLPRVVCEYEDVFPDELPGLPPQRVIDFGIELHPSTSPISMTPHRMAPVELQELRV